jgi:hypothetical protein
MTNRFFPWFLVVFIAGINAANYWAIHHSSYFYIPRLDIPMHFLCGVWIGLATLWWYFFSGRFLNIPDGRRTAIFSLNLTFFSALTIAVLWEVFEYVVHIVMERPYLNNIPNSGSDIFFGVLGAMFAAGFFVIKKYFLIKR